MKKRNIVALVSFVTLILTIIFKENFRAGLRVWAYIFFFLSCGAAGLLYKNEGSLRATPYLAIAIIGIVMIGVSILQLVFR